MISQIRFKAQHLTERRKKLYKGILILIALCFLSGITVISIFFEQTKPGWSLLQENSGITSTSLEESFVSFMEISTGAADEPSCSAVISNEQQLFPVYLVGEVIYPGIYMIGPETFLYQLVERAGGFTQAAALDCVNLAFLIEKNQTIRIPSKDEIKSGHVGQFTEEILVVVVPDNNNYSDLDSDGVPAKININTATQVQLESLPGIGPATAQQIIEYRTTKGLFKNIESIMNVSGIKENKFALIKSRIVV